MRSFFTPEIQTNIYFVLFYLKSLSCTEVALSRLVALLLRQHLRHSERPLSHEHCLHLGVSLSLSLSYTHTHASTLANGDLCMPAAAPAPSSQQQARAMYDFQAENADELEFTEGQVINIINTVSNSCSPSVHLS